MLNIQCSHKNNHKHRYYSIARQSYQSLKQTQYLHYEGLVLYEAQIHEMHIPLAAILIL